MGMSTNGVCPTSYFPFMSKKKYAPFWDTPEFSALKLCQTFCNTEGAGLHHLVAMCSMCVHATKNKTCINSINMCNAMQRHATPLCIVSTQNTSWDLLRFAFSTGSSSFVLKKMSFSQQFVFDIFALENGWKRCLRTKRSCENTKCRAKQPENLHRFCWLHFCKEVLGSLLKVSHRTLKENTCTMWKHVTHYGNMWK